MDAASLLPVKALAVQVLAVLKEPHLTVSMNQPLTQEGDSVLDMCAAPGGKTLALAMNLNLWPRALGQLKSNDVSNDRRRRLRQVIETYLPEASISQCIKVTGHDCTTWRHDETDTFDRILLDAPCSTERHLMRKPEVCKQTPKPPSPHFSSLIQALLGNGGLVAEPAPPECPSTAENLAQWSEGLATGWHACIQVELLREGCSKSTLIFYRRCFIFYRRCFIFFLKR